jgi:hypothetical protein
MILELKYKNVKNIFLSMCDIKMFLTFTSLSLVLLWQLFYLFCSSIVINTVIVTAETDKISQQPENCENRNDLDLVQAFLKKLWVESDFKAPNLPLSLRLKVSRCHYNSIYNNTWTKQVKPFSLLSTILLIWLNNIIKN